jgi:ribosomal protein L23
VNVLNNSIKFKKVFLGRKRVEKIKGGQKKAYVSLKKGYSINFENSL